MTNRRDRIALGNLSLVICYWSYWSFVIFQRFSKNCRLCPSAPLRLFPWRLTSPGQQSKLDRNVTIAASIRLTKGSCMRNLHPFLSAGVLLCLSLPAYPQSDRGVLTGTVTDSSGAVIPGASVTATNTATNVSASTVTTEGGFYAIPALQPGTYKVRVELTGFKAYEQSQVVIAAATTVRVDAKLEIGQISESVEVTSSAARLQTENSKISASVSNKMV